MRSAARPDGCAPKRRGILDRRIVQKFARESSVTTCVQNSTANAGENIAARTIQERSSPMGLRNYDRWSPEEWRRTAETVAQMHKARWDVLSYCRACHLTMRVDLALVERVSGPHTVLWNRKARCRRIGCDGVVEFSWQASQSHHLHQAERRMARTRPALKPCLTGRRTIWVIGERPGTDDSSGTRTSQARECGGIFGGTWITLPTY